jgi:carbon monoxide dehydrogenase subunit G
MDISGEYRVPASRERVWRALTEETILRACLPGCQSLERVAGLTYAGTIAAPVAGREVIFNSRIAFSDIDEPAGCTVTAEGEAGEAGFAHSRTALTLEESGGETLVRYAGTMLIGGQLANVGLPGLQGSVMAYASEFFRCLTEFLDKDRPGPSADDMPAAVPDSAPVAVPAFGERLSWRSLRSRPPTGQEIIILSGYVIFAVIVILLFFLPKGAGA